MLSDFDVKYIDFLLYFNLLFLPQFFELAHAEDEIYFNNGDGDQIEIMEMEPIHPKKLEPINKNNKTTLFIPVNIKMFSKKNILKTLKQKPHHLSHLHHYENVTQWIKDTLFKILNYIIEFDPSFRDKSGEISLKNLLPLKKTIRNKKYSFPRSFLNQEPSLLDSDLKFGDLSINPDADNADNADNADVNSKNLNSRDITLEAILLLFSRALGELSEDGENPKTSDLWNEWIHRQKDIFYHNEKNKYTHLDQMKIDFNLTEFINTITNKIKESDLNQLTDIERYFIHEASRIINFLDLDFPINPLIHGISDSLRNSFPMTSLSIHHLPGNHHRVYSFLDGNWTLVNIFNELLSSLNHLYKKKGHTEELNERDLFILLRSHQSQREVIYLPSSLCPPIRFLIRNGDPESQIRSTFTSSLYNTLDAIVERTPQIERQKGWKALRHSLYLSGKVRNPLYVLKGQGKAHSLKILLKVFSRRQMELSKIFGDKPKSLNELVNEWGRQRYQIQESSPIPIPFDLYIPSEGAPREEVLTSLFSLLDAIAKETNPPHSIPKLDFYTRARKEPKYRFRNQTATYSLRVLLHYFSRLLPLHEAMSRESLIEQVPPHLTLSQVLSLWQNKIQSQHGQGPLFIPLDLNLPPEGAPREEVLTSLFSLLDAIAKEVNPSGPKLDVFYKNWGKITCRFPNKITPYPLRILLHYFSRRINEAEKKENPQQKQDPPLYGQLIQLWRERNRSQYEEPSTLIPLDLHLLPKGASREEVLTSLFSLLNAIAQETAPSSPTLKLDLPTRTLMRRRYRFQNRATISYLLATLLLHFSRRLYEAEKKEGLQIQNSPLTCGQLLQLWRENNRSQDPTNKTGAVSSPLCSKVLDHI